MPTPPYRGGGTFGTSIYPDSRPQVDYAGAFDALLGGARNLVQDAYTRKLTDFQQQRQERMDRAAEAERARVAKHQEATLGLQQQEFASRERERGQNYSLKRDQARREALTQGVTPAHDETLDLPARTSVVRAMTARPTAGLDRGPDAQGINRGSVYDAMSRPPETAATVEQPAISVTARRPETYDPNRALRVVGPQAAAETRGQSALSLEELRSKHAKELEDQKAANRQKAQAFMVDARVKLEREKQRVQQAAGGKPMTAAQKEAMLQKSASGLLASVGGSYDAAFDALSSTEEGKALTGLGLGARHLMIAHGQSSQTATRQALQLESGGMNTPGEAARDVKNTGRLVSPKPSLTPSGSTPGSTGNVDLRQEADLSDADLWEKKVREGMPKDQATQYVRKRKR